MVLIWLLLLILLLLLLAFELPQMLASFKAKEEILFASFPCSLDASSEFPS
jgi:hypothetical protein